MADEKYALPDNGDCAGSIPQIAGDTQQAVKTEAETLDEINAKLDAILAALGGKGQ